MTCTMGTTLCYAIAIPCFRYIKTVDQFLVLKLFLYVHYFPASLFVIGILLPFMMSVTVSHISGVQFEGARDMDRIP